MGIIRLGKNQVEGGEETSSRKRSGEGRRELTPLQNSRSFFAKPSVLLTRKVKSPSKDSVSFVTGFTMVEIFVIMIMLITISSILLANFPVFSQRVNLQRSAQNLAISLRKAQNMAFAVRQVSTTPPRIPPAFGMHLKKSDDNKSYIIFADFEPRNNNNNIYDAAANNTCPSSAQDKDCVVEKISLQGGITIADMTFSSDGLNSDSVNELDIAFSVPEARTSLRKEGRNNPEGVSAEIILQSTNGSQRKVVISATGQIYTR